jgi:hypothetical protein
MKHSNLYTCLLAAIVLICSSCSVTFEKRRYRPGYHIETFHTQKKRHTVDHFSTEKWTPEDVVIKDGPNPDHKDSLKEGASFNKVSAENNETEIKPHSSSHKKSSPTVIDHHPNQECDLLVLKEGTQIEVIVIEITETEVKYRKCNYPDGPVYVISNSKVDVINFKNGDFYRPNPEDVTKEPNNDVPGYLMASLIIAILSIFSATLGFIFQFFVNTTFHVIGFIIGCFSLIEATVATIMGLTGLKTKSIKATISTILGIIAFILSIIVIVLTFV